MTRRELKIAVDRQRRMSYLWASQIVLWPVLLAWLWRPHWWFGMGMGALAVILALAVAAVGGLGKSELIDGGKKKER